MDIGEKCEICGKTKSLVRDFDPPGVGLVCMTCYGYDTDLVNALRTISRLLDNLNYECESRKYILDDAMGTLFYCRDLAQITLKEYNEKL